jgi:hypothetical protein
MFKSLPKYFMPSFLALSGAVDVRYPVWLFNHRLRTGQPPCFFGEIKDHLMLYIYVKSEASSRNLSFGSVRAFRKSASLSVLFFPSRSL